VGIIIGGSDEQILVIQRCFMETPGRKVTGTGQPTRDALTAGTLKRPSARVGLGRGIDRATIERARAGWPHIDWTGARHRRKLRKVAHESEAPTARRRATSAENADLEGKTPTCGSSTPKSGQTGSTNCAKNCGQGRKRDPKARQPEVADEANDYNEIAPHADAAGEGDTTQRGVCVT